MTITELWQVFDNCGVPVFDTIAPAGTFLPYAVMIVTEPDNSAADNKVYSVNPDARIELYTLGKDYTTCAKIENALQDACLPWNHDTAYLDGQKIIQEIYTFGTVTGAVEPVPEV